MQLLSNSSKSTEPLKKVSGKHIQIYIRKQIHKNLILCHLQTHTPLASFPWAWKGNLYQNSDITPGQYSWDSSSISPLHIFAHPFLLATRPWVTRLVHLRGNCHSWSNLPFLPIIAEKQDTYPRITCYLLVSVYDPSSFFLVLNTVPATKKHKWMAHQMNAHMYYQDI